jgi:hypothetical protein
MLAAPYRLIVAFVILLSIGSLLTRSRGATEDMRRAWWICRQPGHANDVGPVGGENAHSFLSGSAAGFQSVRRPIAAPANAVAPKNRIERNSKGARLCAVRSIGTMSATRITNWLYRWSPACT